MSTKMMVWAALLTALAIVIPMTFANIGLVIILGPFTATLASHVPVMISMLLTPGFAFVVGLGSALGFLLILGQVVAARAAMHAVVAATESILITQGVTFRKALLVTLPLHALLESLVVLPFGYNLYQAVVVVGLGTALHHGIDMLIAVWVAKVISPLLPENL